MFLSAGWLTKKKRFKSCIHYWHPKFLTMIFFSLHLQASSKERVSLMTKTIRRQSFRRHMARDGTLGLLTHNVTLFKIHHMALSGESLQAGKIQTKVGKTLVT